MPDVCSQRVNLKITPPRRALSVRVRLMILAVIAIVPLLLERIHNEEFDRNERIEAAYKQARDLARQGAAEQNDEEDHLPEERDPALEERAPLFTVVAG